MRLSISYRNLLFTVSILCLASLKLFAASAEMSYEKANRFYQLQNFDSAFMYYDSLIKEGFREKEIFYNIGNCYYKKTQTARAILFYERALRMDPFDEDSKFNLKIAQLNVIDKMDAVPEIFYDRWLNTLSSLINTDVWAKCLTLCTWLFFLSASAFVVSVHVKKTFFVSTVFFVLLSLICWFFTFTSQRDTMNKKEGIIMSSSAYVKSSPGENNTDLFLLHEGTKVSMLDSFDQWIKIRVTNGSIGWILRKDVEEI